MRICFVCLGNICRSPTAEGVMRRLAATAGIGGSLVLESAGTGGWHVGEPSDQRSCEAAARCGYDLTGHRAQQFTVSDFDRFDLVIAMDRSNLGNLKQLANGRTAPPIRLFRSFDPTAPDGAEVPDPYSGDAAGFDRVLEICERASRGLITWLGTSKP